MSEKQKIYIATVLLEKNRWEDDRQQPSYLVSEWMGRFAEAGFDGVELWENHAKLCGPEELAAIEACPLPVAVFSSYAKMDNEGQAARDKAVELTKRLGAAGVKFNVQRDPSRRGIYMKNLKAWRTQFPSEVSLLCECHSGTILEEPAEARKFFDEIGPNDWGVIIHPFRAPETVKTWFEQFGPAVTHAHLQMRDGRKLLRLDRKPDRAKQAIRILREEGFCGSFTLEFTEGIGPGEKIEELFRNATIDLEFLREALS